MPKMTPETIYRQILPLLRFFRSRYRKGQPVHKAYRDAVREVAENTAVTYQTIGDACRRRLGLKKIDELYGLLERWVGGDAMPLATKLKIASAPPVHAAIDAFFAGEGG